MYLISIDVTDLSQNVVINVKLRDFDFPGGTFMHFGSSVIKDYLESILKTNFNLQKFSHL